MHLLESRLEQRTSANAAATADTLEWLDDCHANAQQPKRALVWEVEADQRRRTELQPEDTTIELLKAHGYGSRIVYPNQQAPRIPCRSNLGGFLACLYVIAVQARHEERLAELDALRQAEVDTAAALEDERRRCYDEVRLGVSYCVEILQCRAQWSGFNASPVLGGCSHIESELSKLLSERDDSARHKAEVPNAVHIGYAWRCS